MLTTPHLKSVQESCSERDDDESFMDLTFNTGEMISFKKPGRDLEPFDFRLISLTN